VCLKTWRGSSLLRQCVSWPCKLIIATLQLRKVRRMVEWSRGGKKLLPLLPLAITGKEYLTSLKTSAYNSARLHFKEFNGVSQVYCYKQESGQNSRLLILNQPRVLTTVSDSFDSKYCTIIYYSRLSNRRHLQAHIYKGGGGRKVNEPKVNNIKRLPILPH